MNNVIIQFEDLGQDFIEWELEYIGPGLMKVVNSKPFQANVWIGFYVLNGPGKKGELLLISKSPKDEVLKLKYPIKHVRTTDAKGKTIITLN